MNPPSALHHVTLSILLSLALVAPAYATPPAKDALNIQINTLPTLSKVEGRPDVKTSIGLPSIPAVFSGGVINVDLGLDTRRSKEAPGVKVNLPKDLKGAADGALKGNLKATLTTPEITFKLPVLGAITIPKLEGETLKIDVTSSPGVATIKISNKNIPKLPLASGRASAWEEVTNLGSGEAYYYNRFSGESQYDYPL